MSAKTIEKVQQGEFLVSPKEIYCGDVVTLQFKFSPTYEVLNQIVTTDEVKTTLKLDPLLWQVNELKLEKNETEANLTVECICWQPGEMIIPEFSIILENTDLQVSIPPFTVSSILEKTGETAIKGSMGPIIVPGTTYVVYGFIFLGIILLSLLIFTLTKLSKIILSIKTYREARRYKKNYKKIQTRLKKLLKNTVLYSEEDFSFELQVIMRDYFAFRFSPKIYSLVTSEIVDWFNKTYSECLSDAWKKSVDMFYTLMLRCDYLRFSGETLLDSKMYSDERNQLVQKAENIMKLIEEGE